MRHQPTVFDSLLQHIPWAAFDRLTKEHGADDGVRSFDSRDHLIAMLGAALGGLQGQRQTVTSARVNDITAAKRMLPIEPGATYVFDLGYYDFGWWAALRDRGCRFVTRLKRNTPLREVEHRAVAPGGMVLSDRTGRLPERLAQSRRNPFHEVGREIVIRISTGRTLRLFTNDLDSPAEAIADLYKERWQIELFFKWIKQNLRISRFMGASENAVRLQIATALIAYILVRLTQIRHAIAHPAVIVLTVIRGQLFTRKTIPHLLDPPPRQPPPPNPQLSLFPSKR